MPEPQPDGRPSDLYEIKGPGFKAQVLVDTKTNEVYCVTYTVRSMNGWSLDKLTEWTGRMDRWSMTKLGSGTDVKGLKET